MVVALGTPADDRFLDSGLASSWLPPSAYDRSANLSFIPLRASPSRRYLKTLRLRFPLDSFSSLEFLQAAPHDLEALFIYASVSSVDTVRIERGTVALRCSDRTQWSVEELIAMQFTYVRDLAESTASERVNDVIVTVPPYYTQFDRDTIVNVIEISGLHTVVLINDGTAVAVNYAMTRPPPTRSVAPWRPSAYASTVMHVALCPIIH